MLATSLRCFVAKSRSLRPAIYSSNISYRNSHTASVSTGENAADSTAKTNTPTANARTGNLATLSEAEKLRMIREDKIAPASGRPLDEIAAEIWRHNTSAPGPGHRSGLKVLEKPLKGPLYTSWYPIPASKNPHNPFKLTDKQERWKNKLKILRSSGRGPPKKGAGKRSK